MRCFPGTFVESRAHLPGAGSGHERVDLLESAHQPGDRLERDSPDRLQARRGARPIAGRPGQGKTAFMMSAAKNAAHRNKHVAIFSLEMSNDQLVQRLERSEHLDSPLVARDEVGAAHVEVGGRRERIGPDRERWQRLCKSPRVTR